MSQERQSEEVTRAMVVFAHPDDAECGCGGTIAKWASEGIEFVYVVATDGSKGSADPAMSPERLIAMRRQEQRKGPPGRHPRCRRRHRLDQLGPR